MEDLYKQQLELAELAFEQQGLIAQMQHRLATLEQHALVHESVLDFLLGVLHEDQAFAARFDASVLYLHKNSPDDPRAEYVRQRMLHVRSHHKTKQGTHLANSTVLPFPATPEKPE